MAQAVGILRILNTLNVLEKTVQSEEDRWTLIVVTQERGTKKEVANSLIFDTRENAVKAEEHLIAQAGRGGNLPITLETERGDRLTIIAMDFRRAKIEKFWSGIL